MNPAVIALKRGEAMLDFEEGRVVEARVQLDDLITQIGTPSTNQLRGQLCWCLCSRALLHGYAHRWQEALRDLEECETLALALSPLARRNILLLLYQYRVKLLATPFSSIFDRGLAEQSLAQLQSLGTPEWITDELASDLAFRVGDWERAGHLASRAAHVIKTTGWPRPAATLGLRAGRAWLEMGDLDKAAPEINAAHEFFRHMGPPDQLAMAQLALARLHSAYGNTDTAWDLADEALQGIEALIRRFRSLFDQQRFLLDKLTFYDQVVSIALARGGTTGCLRAWATAERAKSMYLCLLVANADVPLFEDVEPALVDEIQGLEEQLDACEAELGRLNELAPMTSRHERAEQLEQQRTALATAKQQLLETMMHANPRWAGLRSPPPLDLQAELQRMAPSWTPLTYYWHPDLRTGGANLLLFSMNVDLQPHHHSVAWSRSEIEDLERHLADFLALDRGARFLADVVPAPLVDKLLPVEARATLYAGNRALISPHGPSQAIPVHTLRDAHGERLIDQCAVQYIPSLGLLPLRRETERRDAVLLIGCEQDGFGSPRLDAVPDELATLAGLWSAKRPGTVKTESVPPDGSLKDACAPIETWDTYEVLHIACHGVFPAQYPFDAALRLGSEAVRMSEFFAARLNAKLVCLSACSLGRQAERSSTLALAGNEWIGLYLPLFYAGAETLLVSLWDANDRVTSTMMEVLHHELSHNAAPADAFQHACLAVSQKRESLWANWYLVGFPD